jgi:iron complex transport system substrate-binding protein
MVRVRADFDAAVDNVREVAARRSGIIGMGVWPLEVAYVFDPSADPDFSDYTAWGLTMFEPGTTDDGYWRAVMNGQLVLWDCVANRSLQRHTRAINAFAAALDNATVSEGQ